MKSILITAGLGYAGSHVVKLFLEKGFEVTIFDNLSHGFEEVYNILKTYGKLELVKGDVKNINELETLFNNHNFDAVLHFAALCSVNESVEKPELYFSNNTLGSLNLFETMKKHGVKKIIISSTCAVYGEAQYCPVDEKHPINPTNPYGESKLLAEKFLEQYGMEYGFKYVIFRYFNICGADEEGVIGDSKKPSPHLVQNVVRGAMNIEPFKFSCPHVNTPDGTPIRDYTDVNDLAEANFKAFQYLEQGNESQIINLGSGRGTSVKRIVKKVEKMFKTKIPQEEGLVRKGELAKIYADISKAEKVLGWKPKRTLEKSILSLKKWYQKHPQGYTK